MQHTSAQDWATLIAAIAAALVSIINALLHRNLAQQIDANHQETLAQLGRADVPPPP